MSDNNSMQNQEQRKRGLGRGLSALLGDDSYDETERVTVTLGETKIPIENLSPSPFQPRKKFEPNEMAALIDSVKEKGIVQPLLVREKPNHSGHYEIIAGERRWRAAQAALLIEVPVIIRQFSDLESLEIALIENIQRTDLSALEEATAFRRLMQEFGHTQENLAKSLGKSRSHIANTMRLLNLPPIVQEMIESGQLSASHARALITAKDPLALAKLVIENGLSVRETEQLAQDEKITNSSDQLGNLDKKSFKFDKSKAGVTNNSLDSDPDKRLLEESLSIDLGMKVQIDHKGKGGRLILSYESLDQLDDLITKLSK